MQEKVEIVTGAVGSDGNSNIFSAGVRVKYSPAFSAATDDVRVSSCTNIHCCWDYLKKI